MLDLRSVRDSRAEDSLPFDRQVATFPAGESNPGTMSPESYRTAAGPALTKQTLKTCSKSRVEQRSQCQDVTWMDAEWTLRQALLQNKSGAAICVRIVDVQCVVQFTLFLALCCVLHRPLSQVIHCQVLCVSNHQKVSQFKTVWNHSVLLSKHCKMTCHSMPMLWMDGWRRSLRGLTTPGK